MDHKSQHTHLGGTALVQFQSTLLGLPFTGLLVPSKVKGSVTEIRVELVANSWVRLHDPEFHDGDKDQDLKGAHDWNLSGSGPTGINVAELESIAADGTRETDSSGCGQVSHHTHHCNAAVLDFDVSVVTEIVVLVAVGTIFEQIQGAVVVLVLC